MRQSSSDDGLRHPVCLSRSECLLRRSPRRPRRHFASSTHSDSRLGRRSIRSRFVPRIPRTRSRPSTILPILRSAGVRTVWQFVSDSWRFANNDDGQSYYCCGWTETGWQRECVIAATFRSNLELLKHGHYTIRKCTMPAIGREDSKFHHHHNHNLFIS